MIKTAGDVQHLWPTSSIDLLAAAAPQAFVERILCPRNLKSSVPEVFCFWVCPSVSESVRPENLVNTITSEFYPDVLGFIDVLIRF